MWPFVSATTRQPPAAPRSGSQNSGRAQRTRTPVSAVTHADIADDLGVHAAAQPTHTRTGGQTPSHTFPRRSHNMDDGHMSPSRSTVEGDTHTATPSHKLSMVEGDAHVVAEVAAPRAAGYGDIATSIKREFTTQEAHIARLVETTLPAAVDHLYRLHGLYATSTARDGTDWDLTTLVSLIDTIEDVCRQIGRYSEHARYREILSRFDSKITK